MSKISQCLLDCELVESDSYSFSIEYVCERKASKIIVFLPFSIIQFTLRWE